MGEGRRLSSGLGEGRQFASLCPVPSNLQRPSLGQPQVPLQGAVGRVCTCACTHVCECACVCECEREYVRGREQEVGLGSLQSNWTQIPSIPAACSPGPGPTLQGP